jgi:hypothetical protein
LGGQHWPTNGQANGLFATSFLRRKGRPKKAFRANPAQGGQGYKGGAVQHFFVITQIKTVKNYKQNMRQYNQQSKTKGRQSFINT